MQINFSKTKYMLFGDTSFRNSVCMRNNNISYVDVFSLLGLRIDSKLSFNNHCSHLCKKICSFLPICYKFKFFLPFNTKIIIFNAIIVSHIRYSLIIYSNCNISTLSIVSKSYHKALKSLFSHQELMRIKKHIQDYFHFIAFKQSPC